MELIAFDLETTGLDPQHDRIIELGAVRFTLGGSERATYFRLVNPVCEISPGTTTETGISAAMLADSPPADVVLREFLEWVGTDAFLVAHDAPFHVAFLVAELERVGSALPRWFALDSLEWTREQLPIQDFTLRSACNHIGHQLPNLHRALADARGAMHCTIHLANRTEEPELEIQRRARALPEAKRKLATPRQLARLRDLGATEVQLAGIGHEAATELIHRYKSQQPARQGGGLMLLALAVLAFGAAAAAVTLLKRRSSKVVE